MVRRGYSFTMRPFVQLRVMHFRLKDHRGTLLALWIAYVVMAGVLHAGPARVTGRCRGVGVRGAVAGAGGRHLGLLPRHHDQPPRPDARSPALGRPAVLRSGARSRPDTRQGRSDSRSHRRQWVGLRPARWRARIDSPASSTHASDLPTRPPRALTVPGISGCWWGRSAAAASRPTEPATHQRPFRPMGPGWTRSGMTELRRPAG